MIRKTTLFALYIVSYLPLFFILSIQNINDQIFNSNGELLSFREIVFNNKISLILIAISLLATLYYFIFSKVNQRYGFGNPEKISTTKNSGVEYLSYLATYIIPFVGLKFEPWNNLLASIILFLLIGFIYTKTNLIYANPTLALFGFYIYEIETDQGETRTIISKGQIHKEIFYSFKQISDNIYFIKKT